MFGKKNKEKDKTRTNFRKKKKVHYFVIQFKFFTINYPYIFSHSFPVVSQKILWLIHENNETKFKIQFFLRDSVKSLNDCFIRLIESDTNVYCFPIIINIRCENKNYTISSSGLKCISV